MPTFLKKLFEQYAKRLLTGNVRSSISEKGIMTIPDNKRVQLMAENLYKDFKKAGVPDNILKTENDIKVFHHKIAEINNENLANRLGTFEDIFAPKKSAEVFDLKGKKIKNPDNIMSGEEIIETEAQILQRLIKENKDSIGRLKNKPLDPDDVLPNYNETPGEFARRETPGSKENLLQELKIAYRKEFDRLKGDETAKELKEILKNLDTDGVPFAAGGRAGLYQGGQAQIEPDLSDIGHGSDALMARNTLLTPGSQATTSTGLNYLLGEDNDTTRVPYKEKGSVSLSDFIKVQGSGSISGKQDMYSTGEKSAIKLPEGITSNESFINFISTLDIPISEKISLLGDVQYTKFRNKIEKGDKELFLEDPSSYINKKVGIGVDSGTGITGSAKYDIDSGEPEFKIQFKKKFADGGRIPYGHGDMVLPKPKPMDEYMLKQVLSQAGANTLNPKTREMFIEMYKKKIREKNSKADGGRTEYAFGGNPHESDSKAGSGQTSGKRSAPPGEKGGAGYVAPYTPPPGERGGQGYVAPTPKTRPVTTGGQSPFGYTKPEPKSYNYGITNLQKFKNFLGKKTGYTQHNIDNQKLRNALDDEEITEEQYKRMGGFDVAKNMPLGLGSNYKNAGVASGLYNTIKSGVSAFTNSPYAQYGDIGPLESISLNTQGAAGLGKKDQMMYDNIVSGKKFFNMADGGPARQNFGMGKRAFLKLIGSGVAGIAGLKSGILGVGKKSAVKSVIAPATQAANEAAPAYFLKLVAKIKKLGDDVTETGALAERQKVKQYKDFTLTEDTATGRVEVQKVKPFAEGSDNFGNGLTEEVYMGYTPPETIVVKGKPVKTKPQYDEGTAYLRNDGPNTGDVYEEVSGVTDEVLKEVGESLIKKAEGGRIGYKFGKKVVETVIKKAGEGKFTKNEVLLNMFENTIKATKDANTKTKFINFIEEIKLKPELSKDPNVWNFFTKGLPKNQKLVVYGDDTVDFWTQSEFGPHNIATSAKFQKKHPYLTKDQAVKIQNMEPEDQIFEMKRLDAIRKRTANATGGRIGFSAGKGIMAIIKNLLKPKPKKLETVKDFVDKREFMKTIVGNSQKNKNKRILDEILEENKKVKGFEFKNLDVDKEIRPILDQSKNRTLNSSGGIAAMLGE
jgi:hypothetical protein